MLNCRKIRREVWKQYFDLLVLKLITRRGMARHVTRRCESLVLGTCVVGDEKEWRRINELDGLNTNLW